MTGRFSSSSLPKSPSQIESGVSLLRDGEGVNRRMSAGLELRRDAGLAGLLGDGLGAVLPGSLSRE